MGQDRFHNDPENIKHHIPLGLDDKKIRDILQLTPVGGAIQ
jgi:hypothetical protein